MSRLRLALGTACFGLPYGQTNSVGKLAISEAHAILDSATAYGIETVDTAPAYGDAEKVIGRHPRCDTLRVITKTPHFTGTMLTAEDGVHVRQALAQSSEHLGISHPAGLLLHNPADLAKPGVEYVIAAMQESQYRGEVEAIGVSVYNASDVDRALALFRPDIVQVPLNVLDQRIAKSGLLANFATLGVEVFVRSVFLQGLLLSEPRERPSWTLAHARYFERVDEVCRRPDISRLSLCLGYAMSVAPTATIVVGVTSTLEFASIVGATQNCSDVGADWLHLAIDDEELVDPRRWPPVGRECGGVTI